MILEDYICEKGHFWQIWWDESVPINYRVDWCDDCGPKESKDYLPGENNEMLPGAPNDQ